MTQEIKFITTKAPGCYHEYRLLMNFIDNNTVAIMNVLLPISHKKLTTYRNVLRKDSILIFFLIKIQIFYI